MSESGEKKRRLVRITNLGKYRVSLGPLRRSLMPGATVEFTNLPREWMTLRLMNLIDKGILQIEQRELTSQELQELRDEEARELERVKELQRQRLEIVRRAKEARKNKPTRRMLTPKPKSKPKPAEPAPRVFLPDDCDSTTGGSDGEPEQN